MKRGLITWDKTELPPEAFEARLKIVKEHLAKQELAALVVYTDVWKSNHGRYFSNFMPYWNRALLVIPRESPPALLCGLSPRVYPWIRSVTILDEIRPSPNLAQQLLQMCSEKGWTRIGVLDLAGLPHDLYTPLRGGAVEAADVPPMFVRQSADKWELAMYRRAAKLAREVLAEELPRGVGLVDHEFVGVLEQRFRRAGAEDLIILLSNGDTPPLPAKGTVLSEDFSVALALEYRGHWVRVAKSARPAEPPATQLSPIPADTPARGDNLAGPYPYEPGVGRIHSRGAELQRNGRRLFYEETYLRVGEGYELL